MRLFYWLFSLPLLLLVVLFVISNRIDVELGLWPFPFKIMVPIFIVTLGAFLVGFISGGLTSWISGTRHRMHLRQQAAQNGRQVSEIASLKNVIRDLETQIASATDKTSKSDKLALDGDASTVALLETDKAEPSETLRKAG